MKLPTDEPIGGPNAPHIYEPPAVEPLVRCIDLRELLVRGISAAEGAQVLADCYFARAGRDGFNSANYCRLLDWLQDARRTLGKQPK